jgi:hypothetical protein
MEKLTYDEIIDQNVQLKINVEDYRRVAKEALWKNEALQAQLQGSQDVVAQVFKIAHDAIIRKGINTEKTIGKIIQLTETL